MPQRDRHRDQISWPYRRPALQLHVATPPGNYKPRRNISSHMNKSEHHSQPIGIIHRTEASTHQTTTHAGHVMQHTGCHWLHQVCLCAEQRIVLATTAAVAPALSTSSCSLPLSQARRKRTKPWVVCLQACVEHRKQQQEWPSCARTHALDKEHDLNKSAAAHNMFAGWAAGAARTTRVSKLLQDQAQARDQCHKYTQNNRASTCITTGHICMYDNWACLHV
jgi:hypothetical protein